MNVLIIILVVFVAICWFLAGYAYATWKHQKEQELLVKRLLEIDRKLQAVGADSMA